MPENVRFCRLKYSYSSSLWSVRISPPLMRNVRDSGWLFSMLIRSEASTMRSRSVAAGTLASSRSICNEKASSVRLNQSVRR